MIFTFHIVYNNETHLGKGRSYRKPMSQDTPPYLQVAHSNVSWTLVFTNGVHVTDGYDTNFDTNVIIFVIRKKKQLT